MNTSAGLKSLKLLVEEILVSKIGNDVNQIIGSATLVRSKVDNNIYVSKKVLLGNLNQKEVEGAHLEVNNIYILKSNLIRSNC